LTEKEKPRGEKKRKTERRGEEILSNPFPKLLKFMRYKPYHFSTCSWD
jgi:hypothetical protein